MENLMPNGYEMNERLEFERSMKAKDPEERQITIAMMFYDHCEDHKEILHEIKENKRRSWQNRIMLIVIVILLTAYGILDASILHVFGG
jgi:hypothetical protein